MTSLKPWADVKVGDLIPALALPPVSRLDLALYCGASADHNPIHVDIDFVRTTGLPDVIAHGMLSMAWLGRLLTNWVPQTAIREYKVRFAAMTQIGEVIGCTGEVTDKFEHAGEQRVRLSLTTANAEGQVKLSGEAVIALA
jgi:acyl dehydratase